MALYLPFFMVDGSAVALARLPPLLASVGERGRSSTSPGAIVNDCVVKTKKDFFLKKKKGR